MQGVVPSHHPLHLGVCRSSRSRSGMGVRRPGPDVFSTAKWFPEQRTFTESLGIVHSKPKLLASIRHFALQFSTYVKARDMIKSPDFVSFCKTLPPFPSFRLYLSDFDDETVFSPHFEVMDDDDHPLGHILTSFCHSSILTSFAFEGQKFPFDILKSMPNLKDISFQSVYDCYTPHIPNQPSSMQSLPFRLRRARFCSADPVFKVLMIYEETLSEVKELEVLSGDLGESADDEDLAFLLSIPQGTLKSLSIELNDSLACKRSSIPQLLS